MAEAVDDAKKWRRSSYCSDANCVEAVEDGNRILMRDSKDITQPYLSFDRADWQQFVEEITHGRFRSL